MSDSDDTDILLLIPPDFFAIHLSDSEASIGEEHCVDEDVVNSLIWQVCSLDSRLSIIESKESLSSPIAKNFYREEIRMNQPTWLDCNTSTPRSKTLRATSLPPTPSGSITSGAPIYYRSNSYPSPSKSVPISPEQNNFPGKNVFSRKGPTSPSSHITHEQRPSDLRVHNYVSQLTNSRDAQQGTRSRNVETMREVDAVFENLRGRYGNRPRPSGLTNVSSPGMSVSSSQVQQLGLAEVDRLLEKVEADQLEMEAKLSARERQFGLPVGEEVVTAKRIRSFPGDSISSVPDLNLGVRKLWDNKPMQPLPPSTSTTNGVDHTDKAIEEPCVEKKYSLIGKSASNQRNSSLPNGHENDRQGPKVFQSRRRLVLDSSSKPDIERLPDEGSCRTALDMSADDMGSSVLHGGPLGSLSRNNTNPSEIPSAKRSDSSGFQGEHHQPIGGNKRMQNDLGVPASVIAGAPPLPPLMSLADLWGEKNTSQSLTLEQRLEEEKCRREHCEALVQSLQTRLLEAQQRIAVAQRVDSEKDAAIKHLHSTWSRIMEAWNGLEEERDTVANELEAVRTAFHLEKEQLKQRLAKCQDELSKALDLAHGYKEQRETSERIRTEQLEQLVEKVQEVERRLEATTQANSETQTRNTELEDRLAKESEKSAELQKTLTAVKESLTQREADICILTEEKRSLQTRLKEERARGDTLQQSRDSIRKEAEDTGKRERVLQAEVRQLNQQLSSIRSELRDFYQEQLERAVRDKLSEFQSQLDAAEAALHREAENRELAMAEIAARQLKQLDLKHRQEVVLLEQRHAEQLHLAHLQTKEAEKTVLELRKRLEEHEANASNLAQRLHGIMQNQWREALNVVSGPKAGKGEPKPASVAGKGDFARDAEGGAGQAWFLVKQQELQENRRRQRQQKQEEQSPKVHSLPSTKSPHEPPFEQEGLLTQRSTSVTNVPHRAGSSSGDSGEDLQKYIKMLLDRAPGRPFESANVLGTATQSEKLSEKVASTGRDSRSSGGKRPWK